MGSMGDFYQVELHFKITRIYLLILVKKQYKKVPDSLVSGLLLTKNTFW